MRKRTAIAMGIAVGLAMGLVLSATRDPAGVSNAPGDHPVGKAAPPAPNEPDGVGGSQAAPTPRRSPRTIDVRLRVVFGPKRLPVAASAAQTLTIWPDDGDASASFAATPVPGSGEWQAEGLEANKWYWYDFTAPDLAARARSTFAAMRQTVPIELGIPELPRVMVEVRSQDGRPIPGASAFASVAAQSDMSDEQTLTGVTDVEGRWYVTFPLGCQVTECGAAATGFLPARGNVVRTGEGVFQGVVPLTPAARVSGRLRLPHGVDPATVRVRGVAKRWITDPAQRVDVGLARSLRCGVSESDSGDGRPSLETTIVRWPVSDGAFQGSYFVQEPWQAWIVIEGTGIVPQVVSLLGPREALASRDVGEIEVKPATTPLRMQFVDEAGRSLSNAEIHLTKSNLPQEVDVSLPVVETDAGGWMESPYVEPGARYRVIAWPEDVKRSKGGHYPLIALDVTASDNGTVQVRPYRDVFK
jgi:hypothetical protein